jgi:mono/diheme cytochrome c family protein
MRTFAQAAAAAALVASCAALVAGQQAPAAPVFTVEQATAGRAAYAKSCASCHMPDLSGNNEMPPLAGATFISTWGARSTKDLFDYMSASMPYGLPALSTETYEAIAAYILQANGAAAGPQALTASMAMPIANLTKSRSTDSSDRTPPR